MPNGVNKLEKKIFIEGTFLLKTGLHIGGQDVGLSIGGADSIVIRNPYNDVPYIPGSSLKGKMRSMLERLHGSKDEQGNVILTVCECGECNRCKVFGNSADNKKGHPSRIIMRDCFLTNESEAKLRNAPNTQMPYTEVKTEIVLNRVNAEAMPRQIERIPAGVTFQLSMVLNLFENDSAADLLSTVFEGLELVQNDYLGGNGSRGYGQVQFNISKLTYKDLECYEKRLQPKEYSFEVPESMKIQ